MTLDRSPVGAHDVPTDSPALDMPGLLEPLSEVVEARRRTAAEEARAIMAGSTVGTLATLTSEGAPWASVVTYACLSDGTPVLCVSRLALHGRNLAGDPRASLAVSAPLGEDEDPSDAGRVTLAGVVESPQGASLDDARATYEAAVRTASVFSSFGDFTFWLLRVERIRWVGGFGRMASTDPKRYAEAELDPVAPAAAYAVRHLNEDHADALLAMAQAFSGHTDATAAVCLRADRYGLDLGVTTPRGATSSRVGFAAPITEPDGLRAATVELTHRARAAL